ncbi:cation transporter [Candidatus Uhrbacteria bacterium]|nr:cation transporter [Candidatus Uhrbacteria bacterium]
MLHTRTRSNAETLFVAIKMSLAVFFVEAVGGFFTGSLALLSDAGHVFSDLLALIVSLFALWVASRPSNSRRTFGYHRAEVFGALINGLLLLIMAVSIGAESWTRLSHPPQIHGGAVLFIGLVGMLPNIWVVLRLRNATNLNIKSAFWHALGDTLSSVAVVIGAVLILITGNSIFDPIASLVVVVLLILGAVRLLRQVFLILIEGVPQNIDREKISRLVCDLPGVRSTHDVHLWSLCSDVTYFTGHLVINAHPDLNRAQETINNATRALNDAGIHHVTLQIETPDHSCTKEEMCEIVH